MDAAFVHHSFAPHTHDELMVGVMRAGRKRFRCGPGSLVVGPGALSVVNPGQIHTGERADGHRLLYTGVYLPPGVLRRAQDYVQAHLGDGLDLDRLAEVAGIGQRHLIRSFRAASGLTPHAYVTQARVERAKALLRRRVPAAHVALATGFSDQAHLTRMFKRLTGATPARYAAGVGRPGQAVDDGRPFAPRSARAGRWCPDGLEGQDS